MKIEKKIVGWSVLTATNQQAANEAPTKRDIDPRFLRIDKREEGSWDSVTVKASFPTSNGAKKLYFVIGFGTVCGVREGQPVCIERPLEFFVPVGQTDTDYQWVSATMRTLSLAARGGFLTKALEDLRQVVSSEVIWHGRSPTGKGMVHHSVVACLSWMIQDELRKRGYLDASYNEVDLDLLVKRYEQIQALRSGLPADAVPQPVVAGASQAEAVNKAKVGTCPEKGCGGDLVLKDGCKTCLDCGYSKCG